VSVGKVAYGLLFCVVLPALLWLWARGAGANVGLPMVRAPVAGAAVVIAGTVLMALGMWGLRVHGGGLPMNAFPPARRAERGVYAWLDHPIYAGFCAVVAGAAWWAGSAAGVWLVTPCVVLGCAALVYGFERDDLEQRLGRRTVPARLRIAPDTSDPPDLWDRVWLLVLVFVPWLVLYEWIGHAPVGGSLSTAIGLDASVPIVGWMEALYAGTYALGVVPALMLRTRAALRRFEVAGLVGTGLGFWVCVAFPSVFPLREFPAESVWAALHGLERIDGVGGRIAFPSFHVFWAVMGAWAMAQRGAGVLGAVLALGVAAGCVMTGMHGVVDIAGGMVLAAAALNCSRAWRWLLRSAQMVADGWREWRIGPARVLMHAWYAGLSAGVGMLLAEGLAPAHARPALWVMALGGVIGAGVWGQVFEGSGKLARPFGYYGCVLGAGAGAATGAAMGWSVWPAVGALAVAAPWIQAIGRLRCLVQGCCHGSPCAPGRGLRYTTARSRAWALGGLGGVEIHATPVYSIVANVAIGGLLIRLHFEGAPFAIIIGLGVLLSGLARFVEEHFRGEPQTPVIAGLRSYQWLSVLGVIAGAAVTCLNAGVRNEGRFALTSGAAWGAMVCAAVFALAMGVDFPGSSRRFARLA